MLRRSGIGVSSAQRRRKWAGAGCGRGLITRRVAEEAMKITIEVDCTPQEARAALGLPDVSALNEHLVSEMQKRMSANIAALQPEELMKTWLAFGGAAQEQFAKLMAAASGGRR
jgi:hypothetical protein